MKKMRLVLALHGHQPVGNFDHVFERACEQCYQPVLQAFERHAGIRLGLHLSGCLLEWLEDHRPALLEKLAALVEQGRIELLGGGMFEPILAAIPEADAAAQVALMSDFLEDRFGIRPRGAWLAERVWEPQLAGLLSQLGLRYTLVDDGAFLRAGLPPGPLSGYWVTEQAGHALAVLPIDRDLRHALPFEPVAELMPRLRALAEKLDGPVLTYADDLEKFGLWPGTHDWLFGEGWLEEFLAAVEQAADWLEITSPGAVVEADRPRGRIYLPTSAYEELQHWALPDDAAARFERLRSQLAPSDREALAAGPCVPWQAFLVKYPEANLLHKKMLLVSRKLAEALEDDGPWEEEHEEARWSLFRGQCGDALWHGLFGGLYSPQLRKAVYRELIQAEAVLDRRSQGGDDWFAFDQVDFDGDLAEEVVVEHALMNAYLDPARGGVLTELDHRPTAANLCDVLTRRIEPSQSPLRRPGQEPGTEPAPADEESELAGQAVADREQRHCLLDRFPAPGTALEDLQRASYREEGDFLGAVYQVERLGIDESQDLDFEIHMRREGSLTRDDRRLPLVLEKGIRIPADDAVVRVSYRLTNPAEQPLDLVFCPEFNLSLPLGDPAQQSFEFDGVIGPGPRLRSAGELEEAGWIALADGSSRLRIELRLQPATNIWRYPVETVSRAEGGLETNFQGTALAPRWELTIPPGSSIELGIRLSIAPQDEDAVVPLPTATDAD